MPDSITLKYDEYSNKRDIWFSVHKKDKKLVLMSPGDVHLIADADVGTVFRNTGKADETPQQVQTQNVTATDSFMNMMLPMMMFGMMM